MTCRQCRTSQISRVWRGLLRCNVTELIVAPPPPPPLPHLSPSRSPPPGSRCPPERPAAAPSRPRWFPAPSPHVGRSEAPETSAGGRTRRAHRRKISPEGRKHKYILFIFWSFCLIPWLFYPAPTSGQNWCLITWNWWCSHEPQLPPPYAVLITNN